MAELSIQLAAAFSLGLMGSAHCVGMCGGLASALGLKQISNNPNLISSDHSGSKLLAYNFGRIISYSLAGLIVGLFGIWFSQFVLGLDIMRYLAAIMLIAMGLYLTQWWNGLSYLEKIGQHLWRLIQPLGKNLLPVRTTKDALAVGMIWGWLPCGLVYSALVLAAAEPSFLGSILVMFCFGIGTLPAMLSAGFFAHSISALFKQSWFRLGTGLLMILYGITALPIVTKQTMPYLM